jgi:phosphoribosylaminoimidazolecarboxamide formyltransferase/IMP cyclohydrolase
VAKAATIDEAYEKAYMADRIAAFGGAIAVNRELSRGLAERIAESYSEVVVAPEYGEGALSVFEKKPNMRIMKIGNMARLNEWVGERFLDLKSLIDGGLVVQWSYVPRSRTPQDLVLAHASHKGTEYRINRAPTPSEYDDLIFGWLVESGVTSNSVLYVKDGVTVGIGTGEQDRVGVAEIARDKAYRKMQDRIAFIRYGLSFADLKDQDRRSEIEHETTAARAESQAPAWSRTLFFLSGTVSMWVCARA